MKQRVADLVECLEEEEKEEGWLPRNSKARRLKGFERNSKKAGRLKSCKGNMSLPSLLSAVEIAYSTEMKVDEDKEEETIDGLRFHS